MDGENLEKNIRDRIELLGEISKSWALDDEEKSRVVKLRNNFRDRINSIKHLSLGVIGEFNAGKSTLLNSILCKNVVATSSRPCTPVPIHIIGSEKEELKVFYDDSSTRIVSLSKEAINRYTTEGEGSQGVKHLEMTVNSQLLIKNNITLIDTPGINSIKPEHTAATLASLKDMHAAILLMYSGQPGSKSTIEFLQQAANQVHKIFICISKSDFLTLDQLERITKELPGRLTKSSGIKIDKVWPINITENGMDEGLYLFILNIRYFMIREWYEIISNDLRRTLDEYSLKATSLLSNRLRLQEKIFFEYMRSNPIDFSKVAENIRRAAAERIDRDFSPDQFVKLIKTKSNLCRERIHEQISGDIDPNERVFYKLFKKRIKKEEAKIVYNKSMLIFNRLLKQDCSLDKKIERYPADIEKLAMAQLSKIHNTLDEFEKIVLEKLLKDTSIIKQAQWKRFKRWLVLPALTLPGFMILSIIYTFNTLSLLIALLLIVSSFIMPICYYFYPLKNEIYRLAKQKRQSMKQHPIPKFTIKSLQNDFTPQIPNTLINNYYPKAEALYEDFVKVWESNINLYEDQLLKYCRQRSGDLMALSEYLMASTEKYIYSLNENYSFVINEAFEINKELSLKIEDTISSLKNFISRLDQLNITNLNRDNYKVIYNIKD